MHNHKPDLAARSPWAGPQMKEARLGPPTGPNTSMRVHVPGSKSVTNRALIMAAMAEGTSELRNMLRSDDTYWCVDVLRKLGVHIFEKESGIVVEGTGGRWPVREGDVYLGAAGTIARFLPGALAACGSGSWTLSGSASLSGRPIRPLVDALNRLGAHIRYLGADGCLPVAVEGTGLAGGAVEASGAVSSQFISGLLMASPYAARETTITVPDGIVQHAYVGITIDMMRRFGAEAAHSERFDRFTVQPGSYKGIELEVEADASTACYYLGYAALTGGTVRIENWSPASKQPDAGFADILERMGCRVSKGSRNIELQGPQRLTGGFTVSMREMSDQALTLAALAVYADAPVSITDVAHIRSHECDRLRAMCESLERLGIRADERTDGLTVHPGECRAAAPLDTYDDHRMAMSLALLGAKTDGIRLRDPGCVSKTIPSFFNELGRLGMDVQLSQ